MGVFAYSLCVLLAVLKQAVVDGEIKTISLKDYKGGAALLLTGNLVYGMAVHHCCPVCRTFFIGKSQPMLQDAGKYLVFFFYPADFTFVCPSEIVAFSDRIDEFHEIKTEVGSGAGVAVC